MTDGALLQSTAGSLQSLCWASAAVGGIASAYFSGALVDAYGPRGVFGLTAVFPLMVSLSAVFISEQPVVKGRHKHGKDDADAAETGSTWTVACINIVALVAMIQRAVAVKHLRFVACTVAAQACFCRLL